jgi:hypothetical protein
LHGGDQKGYATRHGGDQNGYGTRHGGDQNGYATRHEDHGVGMQKPLLCSAEATTVLCRSRTVDWGKLSMGVIVKRGVAPASI